MTFSIGGAFIHKLIGQGRMIEEETDKFLEKQLGKLLEGKMKTELDDLTYAQKIRDEEKEDFWTEIGDDESEKEMFCFQCAKPLTNTNNEVRINQKSFVACKKCYLTFL